MSASTGNQVCGWVACIMSLTMATGCAQGVFDEEDAVESVELTDALRRCAQGPTVKGIDVSFYQEGVNWASVKQAGYRFGIARISDGTRFRDEYFQRNWSGIKAQGMVRGSYQFFRPQQSATQQAQIVIDAVGKLGPGDLPVVLDVESADGASSAAIVSGMQTWLDLVEEGTGKRPIIYAASGFWNTLRNTSQFASYDLWVANYQATCPAMPDTWGDWTMWQYTDREQVPGVRGGVDANLFQGSYEQLVAYANQNTEPEASRLDAIEVYWARQADGTYKLGAIAKSRVTRVIYEVDGYTIGSATRTDGANFPDEYLFSLDRSERIFKVSGYDATGALVGQGIGLMDVTADVGVYIRQMGKSTYEVGIERAPAGMAGMEVIVDDTYTLTDSVSGVQRSARGAVRATFSKLGSREFTIKTFNADGSVRGYLRRTFELK